MLFGADSSLFKFLCLILVASGSRLIDYSNSSPQLLKSDVFQGFVAGAAWPAMSHMVGKYQLTFFHLENENKLTIGRWIPPNERRYK